MPSSAAGQLAPLADRSFESFDRAVAHLAAPADPDANISFGLGYLDAHFIYPISSPKSVFSIETRFAADLGDYIKVTIRFIPLGEAGQAMLVTGWSGRVPLDPAWYQASAEFVALGIGHILSGIDHMLFLLCLIIPLRRVKELIPVVTAFTVGHSITLIGTAYNLAPVGPWFPPFVEAAIAASIVYMALENIVGANLRRRWIISGLFGLVHGFGFADVLKEQLQFSGSHLLLSLLSFNVGIEIGQLIVLCLYVPALRLSILRGQNVRPDGRDGDVGDRRSHRVALDGPSAARSCGKRPGRRSRWGPSSSWRDGFSPSYSPSALPSCWRSGSSANGRSSFRRTQPQSPVKKASATADGSSGFPIAGSKKSTRYSSNEANGSAKPVLAAIEVANKSGSTRGHSVGC